MAGSTSDTAGDGNALIKNTTSGNSGNGIRLDNTASGKNYYAENVVHDGIQNNGGLNVVGTGDRTNVSF